MDMEALLAKWVVHGSINSVLPIDTSLGCFGLGQLRYVHYVAGPALALGPDRVAAHSIEVDLIFI